MSATDIVIHSDDNAMTSPEPGLLRQVMSYSQKLMLVRHKAEAGWVGAAHSHPHEQIVYVVSGAIQLSVAGVAHPLRAGDSQWVGGGVEHQASSELGAEILDIFTPYREEYAAQ
jgi:quercetin dioxygenase-like cupin family protein